MGSHVASETGCGDLLQCFRFSLKDLRWWQRPASAREFLPSNCRTRNSSNAIAATLPIPRSSHRSVNWHQALDEDSAFQENVRNVARALGKAVKLHRAGKYDEPGKGLVDPTPK
jgi:hypothetical protein